MYHVTTLYSPKILVKIRHGFYFIMYIDSKNNNIKSLKDISASTIVIISIALDDIDAIIGD